MKEKEKGGWNGSTKQKKMCDREQIERMMGNEYWDAE